MAIQKVGVIGCGLMGHGIAQVAAQSGCTVIVRESAQGALDKGMARISKSLAKMVSKEKMTAAQADETEGRLTGTLDLADLADCDLVIEAIIEDLEIKTSLYKELGALCKPETIFASNTSSFPVATMGEASGRPDKMVGLHFFNPVQLMKLVEVVRTPATSVESFEAAKAFGKAVGKAPVGAADTPGFIVNRLLVPYMAEAMRLVERGDATPEDVDTAMKLGCGYPMGP
ncbi:MAG: 3-hydroxybutyryl-CoA dehydrogenase, partial [Pseudohongiellaceae bacterium]